MCSGINNTASSGTTFEYENINTPKHSSDQSERGTQEKEANDTTYCCQSPLYTAILYGSIICFLVLISLRVYWLKKLSRRPSRAVDRLQDQQNGRNNNDSYSSSVYTIENGEICFKTTRQMQN